MLKSVCLKYRHTGTYLAGIHLADGSILQFDHFLIYRFRLKACRNDEKNIGLFLSKGHWSKRGMIMKFRMILSVMLTVVLTGCMTSPTVSTIPSSLELESSKNIDQFIDKIKFSNVVDEVNKGNIVYLKYYDQNNAAKGMQDSLIKLCEERYQAKINKTQDINLHEYGGSQLRSNQAAEAARQWILRKYPEIEILDSDVIAGQCIRYQGEAQIVEILYAYQIIIDPESEEDAIIPVHLIVIKSGYFDSMIEQTLADEPETYEQRKERLTKEAVIAKQREQIEKAKQAKIKMMAPFIDARGKQVCKKFTTSDKLVKYEINRQATITGFLKDNTDSKIQVRITGLSVENKKLQHMLVSDDIKYKGSKAVPGNIIWDSPAGWYFCNK